jgi:hypothetical protein
MLESYGVSAETVARLAWTPIVARNTFPVDATCKLFGVEPPRGDCNWWQQQAETVVN